MVYRLPQIDCSVMLNQEEEKKGKGCDIANRPVAGHSKT
jgi:hypothetical protein